MIPFRKSLPFRLLVVSFILLALPLLIDSFVIVQTSYQDAIRDAKGHLLEVATNRELPLAEMQPGKKPALRLLEIYLDLQNNFPVTPDPKLDQDLLKIAEGAKFSEIHLLKLTPEERFVVVASTDPSNEGKDFTNFTKLLDLYSPETMRIGYFSFLSYDLYSFQPYFLIGRVIYSNQKPVGILMISSTIAAQLEKFLAPVSEPYPVHFALLLPNTVIFASSDASLQYQYLFPIDEKTRAIFSEQELFAKHKLSDQPLETSSLGYPFIEFTWKGKKQIGYIKRLSTSTISLLTYAGKEDIVAQPYLNFLDIYSSFILILLIGGSIAYFLVRRLAQPMFQLGRVMQDIQAGKLEKRYKPDRLGFEINFVGQIFNTMIETLLQKQQLLEKERVKRETYAQELRIGQQVQRSLIVEKVPEYSGVEVAERYIPAKEVGGDFYDVFVRTNHNGEELLALAIADASGKGVRACFFSLGLRSMLRTYAKDFDDVGEVMARTNRLFCLDTGDTGMFVTVFMGYYNHTSKEFSYYSCGHNPSLLRKKNGDVFPLNHLGMAMGLEPNIQPKTQKIILESGDLVIFYTDGITEAHDVNYRMFTEERLIRFIKEEGDLSAKEVAQKLLEEVQVFVGSAPQHDDITLLIMKVL